MGKVNEIIEGRFLFVTVELIQTSKMSKKCQMFVYSGIKYELDAGSRLLAANVFWIRSDPLRDNGKSILGSVKLVGHDFSGVLTKR